MTIVDDMLASLSLVASIGAYPFFRVSTRGRERLHERYGHWDLPSDLLASTDVIWVHGASVGELGGIAPIVSQLRGHLPHLQVLATTTTTTGVARAAEFAVSRLLPFDSEVWFKRALKGLNPRAFILSETELWPGLLRYLAQRHIPMYLVNARISDYSFARYKRLRKFFGPLLQKFEFILASSEEARRRLIEIGALAEKVEVSGNSKYDFQPQLKSLEDIEELRRQVCGNALPTLVLGSLRPGEEEWWLEALLQHTRSLPLNVILAPRHQEKFEYFAEKLHAADYFFERYSNRTKWQGNQSAHGRIVLVDTYGDLNRLYALADLAFVGGSFVDVGGHNPLEPAQYARPVSMGTYSSNVREIVEELQAENALLVLKTKEEVQQALIACIHRDAKLKEGGLRAQLVSKRHAGATARIVDRLLNSSGFIREINGKVG